MFGIFKSRLPLSTFTRVDIELLLRRNFEVIGREKVLSVDVVADVDQLKLEDTSADRLLTSAATIVARRMDGEPISPTFRDPEERDHVAADPLRAVVEIANQMSLQKLLSQPSSRPLDHHPRTTTLMPIGYGLGVLSASAALQEKHWSAAGYSGWSISRCGYYSAIELGYALALFARFRSETDPPWMNNLRLDARKTARNALQFFAKHEAAGGELLFDAQRIPASDRDASELARWLSGDDPSFAMAAAYALAKSSSLSTQACDAAMRLTRGADAELVVVSTRLLGAATASNVEVSQRIETLIADKRSVVSLAALHAAERRSMDIAKHAKRIERLLTDSTLDLIPLIEVIEKHARPLAALANQVCRQIEIAIRFGDVEATTILLRCLARMVDNPIAKVERCIRNTDTRRKALDTLSTNCRPIAPPIVSKTSSTDRSADRE